MGSLDDLVSFLLQEVALCGDQGASAQDFLHYINLFYSREHSERHGTGSHSDGTVSQTVDRSFQEQVWKWISKHPDIRIGQNGEANGMTLSAIGAFNQPLLGSTTTERRREGFDDQAQATASVTCALHLLTAKDSLIEDQEAPRIYASSEQMWLAAAGHGPDTNKMQYLDFQCLMVIASSRESGIIQRDLVKATGQDKRSVPVRTQRLQYHGYIVKIPVISDGNNTSMLFLRRFAPQTRLQRKSDETSFPVTNQLAGEQNIAFKYSKFQGFEGMIQKALDIIREHGIVIWNDLKKKLEILLRPPESKLLSEAVRRLESIGCLQRVRAAGVTKRPGKTFHRCVKLLREPTEEDWQGFFDLRMDHALKANIQNEHELEEANGDESYQIDRSIVVDDSHEENTELEHERNLSRGVVPQWCPDRPLAHILYEVASRGGVKGVSFSAMKEQAVGSFFGRPLENLVGRIVDFWQISQPLHLRHLALVRDAAQVGKTGYYIHYTWDNFNAKVGHQEAAWESVRTMKEPCTELVRDEFGFSVIEASRFCGSMGNANLDECVRTARARAFGIRKMGDSVHPQSGSDFGLHTESEKIMDTQLDIQNKSHMNDEILAIMRQRELEDNEYPTTSITGARLNKGSPLPKKRGRPRKTETQAGAPPKKKGRPRKTGSQPASKRRKRQRGQVLGAKPYIPSIVAHTLITPTNFINAIATIVPKVKKPYRSRKIRSAIGYFPSTLAHKLSLLIRFKNGADTDKVAELSTTPDSVSCRNLPTFKKRLAVSQLTLGNEQPSKQIRTGTVLPMQDYGSCKLGEVGVPSSGMYDEFAGCIHASVQEDSSGKRRKTTKAADGAVADFNYVMNEAPQTYNQQLCAIDKPTTGINVGFPTPLSLVSRGQGPESQLVVSKPHGFASMTCFRDTTSSLALASNLNDTTQDANTSKFGHSFQQSTVIVSGLTSNQSFQIMTFPHALDQDASDRFVFRASKRKSSLSPTGNQEVPSTRVYPLNTNHTVGNISVIGDSQGFLQHNSDSMSAQHDKNARGHASEHITPLISDQRHTVTQESATFEPIPAQSLPPQTEAHMSSVPDYPNQSDKDGISNLNRISEDTNSVRRPIDAPNHKLHFPQSKNQVEIPSRLSNTINIETSSFISQAESTNPSQASLQQPYLLESESVRGKQDHENISDAARSNSSPNIDLNQFRSRDSSVTKVSRDHRRRPISTRPVMASKMVPFGGSTAAARRQIMTEIVEKCGGVFPGDRELWYAFTTLWMQRTGGAKPDQRTVKQTKKALVDTGKLQQFTFSFKNKHGIVTPRVIIAQMSISASDPIVKDLQEQITSKDPRMYFPENIHIDPNLTISRYGNDEGFKTSSKNLQVEEEEVQYHYMQRKTTQANPRKKLKHTQNEYKSRAMTTPTPPLLRHGPGVASSSTQKQDALPTTDFISSNCEPGRSELLQGESETQRIPGIEPNTSSLPRHNGTAGIDDYYPYDLGNFIRVMESRGLHDVTDQLHPDGSEDHRATLPSFKYHSFTSPRNPPREMFTRFSIKDLSTIRGMSQHVREAMSISLRKQKRTILGLVNQPFAFGPYEPVFHAPTGTFSTSTELISNGGTHPKTSTQYDHGAISCSFASTRMFKEAREAPSNSSATHRQFIPAQQERHAADTLLPTQTSLDKVSLGLRAGLPHAVSPQLLGHEKRSDTAVVEAGSNKRKRKMQTLEPRVKRVVSLMRAPEHLPPSKPTINENREYKRIRLRGSQARMVLPAGGDRCIYVASVILRCLAGGVEQTLDWDLLTKIFEPEWDRAFLKQRWNWIRERFKPVADKMLSDFQDIFVRAYEEGIIPPLDYDKLEEYDWKWIHQWTMDQLNTPTRACSELPRNRNKLEKIYQVKDQHQYNMIDYYEAKGIAPIPRRYSVIHNEPFVIPLVGSRFVSESTDELSLAKNWIRANVMTPPTAYSSEYARVKLDTLGNANLNEAVQELLQAKLISQDNKGRAVPGRTYDISDHFFSRLKMNLEIIHFKQAAAYKRHLDDVFQAEGKAAYSFLATDGDMLALINLVAAGRLKMRQANVPKHKHGLMDNGYQTRQIDKERLHFTVEFEPSDTYCEGNPLLPLPRRPRRPTEPDDTSLSSKRFPAWVDINGNVVRVIWDLVLTAVISTLAIRPGTNAMDLAQWTKPSLEVFEIQVMMAWLVESRAASWTSNSYDSVRLEEWWWMVLEGDGG